MKTLKQLNKNFCSALLTLVVLLLSISSISAAENIGYYARTYPNINILVMLLMKISMMFIFLMIQALMLLNSSYWIIRIKPGNQLWIIMLMEVIY